MSRNRTPSAALSVLRSALPSLLGFVALMTAVIGILAMHVWMGGHGPTPHHLGAPAPAGTSILSGAGDGANIIDGYGSSEQGGSGVGHAHAQTGTAVVAAVTSTTVHTSSPSPDAGLLVGCGGNCGDEMMLGMCVLAMVVVGVIGLLTPTSRALSSVLGRRGPPVLHWVSLPAPVPSLTQLCISRT